MLFSQSVSCLVRFTPVLILFPSAESANGAIHQVNFYGARSLTDGLVPLMAGLQRRRSQSRQRESCVVNISSGDGELAFLCTDLQEMIRKLKRLDQLDALADGLVDTSVLPHQELAFGPAPAYCVSKALLNAYTRLCAGRGLNVIAVCPGDVATRMCSDPESPILQSPQQASQDVISLALRCESGRSILPLQAAWHRFCATSLAGVS